ncbi:MAG: FHA domain-containing protein [bacterium]
MRKIIGLALIFLPFLAFARDVAIHFPKEGKYILFVQDDVQNVYPLQGKDVVVSLPERDLHLAIADENNRAGIKDLKAKDTTLTFSEGDLTLIYKVIVKLTDSKGTPIDYCTISLTDSKGDKHTAILREEDEGKCFFYFLPQGKGTLEARRGDLRITQDIEISQTAEPKVFNLSFASLSLPTKAKPQEKKMEKRAKEKPAPRKGISPFTGVFFSLVIIVIILYVVFLLLKRRGFDIIGMLKGEVRQPSTVEPSPPTIPASPDICPYCGQRKDPVTGACACTPTATPSPSLAPSGQAKLIGYEGAVVGQVFPIGKETTIGRGEDRDIVVPDSAVSRRHCKIVLEEDGYYIVDEGSTNGTFVGGMRVAREKLKNGDIIQIGESKFRFEL